MISNRNFTLNYVRYIIICVIKPFGLVAVTLAGIVWLMQSLRFLDYIVNKGLGLGTFFYLSSLLFPSILMFILPISLFCGVIYAYNKLNSDNELIILKSSGLNSRMIARPAIILSIIVLVINYIIAFYILPISYRNYKDLQTVIKDNYASMLLQEGVFNNPVKSLTVYIESRDSNGLLNGIFVHDNRTPENPTTMMAQHGAIINSPEGNRLLLSNGNRQEINKKREELNLLYFDKYYLDLSQYASIKAERVLEPQERFLSQLFYPTDIEGKNVKRNFIKILKAEGHQRLIWPIYNIILTMIALIGVLNVKFNRRGNSKNIFITSSIAGLIIINAMIFANLATNYAYMIFFMYFLLIISFTVSYTMLMPDSKFKILFDKLLERFKEIKK